VRKAKTGLKEAILAFAQNVQKVLLTIKSTSKAATEKLHVFKN